MAKSAAFLRIRQQVLAIVATIPPGRVCTYQSIGEHLAVMPRHVAYILSQLADNEKMLHPWHRVVSANGSLGAAKRAPDGSSQADRLAEEGIAVIRNSLASALEQAFIPASALPSGIPRQTRP